MAIIEVVCGIIFKGNKILLCRRKPDKFLGGYWEFPGGKVEIGEQEEDSLRRELQEELGMKVTVDRHFKTITHHYDTFAIRLISYICKFEEATYKLTDHDQYEWVNQRSLNTWNLAPADIPIANELVASSNVTP
jgi:8-oxo-dGTP diphosphatase